MKEKDKKINPKTDILQSFHVSFFGDLLINTFFLILVISCLVSIHHKLERDMTNVDQLFEDIFFKDDHSRVVLRTSTTESDYINANYIEVS